MIFFHKGVHRDFNGTGRFEMHVFSFSVYAAFIKNRTRSGPRRGRSEKLLQSRPRMKSPLP
ncbi:MAG TPA: hypothetical protein DD376_00560 [Sutterella sp.]|nr:hypothetical protein [Sutterella sp.]